MMTQADLAYIADLVVKHFANVFYFDLGRYLIAAGVASLILLVFRSYAKRRRIQERRAGRKDYVRETLSSLRTVFFFGVTTMATVIGVETGVIRFAGDEASALTIALHFALIVLVHDAARPLASRAGCLGRVQGRSHRPHCHPVVATARSHALAPRFHSPCCAKALRALVQPL